MMIQDHSRQRGVPARVAALNFQLPHLLPPQMLNSFSSIALAELGGASLLERQEIKFLLPAARVAPLLAGLESDYSLLEINGRRVFRYQSIYFDTCDLLFYYQHHRGEVPRWKVRERIYLDTGCTYLELKSKDSRHKIHKQRWSAAPETGALFPHLEALGRSELPVQPELLLETIRTSYSRVTLVQASRRERATVDFNLRFSAGSRIRSLPGFAIFEIKQGRRTRCSALIHKLKESGFHPTGFSKYCIGSVLLDPTLKHNRFKPILRQIQSFDTGELIHGRPHANPDRLRA